MVMLRPVLATTHTVCFGLPRIGAPARSATVVSSSVDFDKNGVGDMFLMPRASRVGCHKQIVTDESHPFAPFLRSVLPPVPIIIAESVFNGDDGYCFAHCPYNATWPAALRVGPPDLWET